MQDPFVLGWEEWLALPELGLPAIKAKVDTGARTSALHASTIEEIGTAERPQVRFEVHPVPGRDDVTVTCVADVVDRRDVTSSNGEVERRTVIRTPVRIGDREWPIEVTLSNREAMAYRMLLGRLAVRSDMFVDPTTSFLQPQLSYRVYGSAVRSEQSPRRHLTIGLLSRRPENASNRRLVRQAELRGHSMPVLDRRRLSLFIAPHDPAILMNGRPLEHLDAIVFRAGRSPSTFSLAIIRQMETLGTLALNPADALARVGDALVMRQTLARAGLPVPEVAVNPSDLGKPGGAEHVIADSLGALRAGRILRLGVVGGRALAMIEQEPMTTLDRNPQWQAAEVDEKDAAAARQVAETAARTLGLGLVAVDVALSRVGPLIVDMTANVSLSQLERLTGSAIAEAVIVHIERAVERSIEARIER